MEKWNDTLMATVAVGFTEKPERINPMAQRTKYFDPERWLRKRGCTESHQFYEHMTSHYGQGHKGIPITKDALMALCYCQGTRTYPLWWLLKVCVGYEIADSLYDKASRMRGGSAYPTPAQMVKLVDFTYDMLYQNRWTPIKRK